MHLFCGHNITPQGKLKKTIDDPDNFNINAIYTKNKLKKYSFVGRWFQEREYGELFAREILIFSPEVVISANTPLDAQKVAIKLCRKRKIQFVFWLMDLIGFTAKAILKQKLPIISSLVSFYFINLERKLLLMSDKIVVTTKAHTKVCENFGVELKKIFLVHNWAPIDDYQVMPRDNEWARRNNTIGKICFMWTGTLGMKHNPDLILQLSLKYKDRKDILIMVISESIGSMWLQEKKKEYDLPNLKILKFQPYEQVPNMMAASDVLIAIVDKSVSDFAVPSKVLSYLCACKPIILAIANDNTAAKILNKHHAGIVIDPNETDRFLSAADSLLNDGDLRNKMAKNGRAYAEKTFDIEKITDKFEKIII